MKICENGHLNVAKWLYGLNPIKYILQISENDLIIYYKILTLCKLEKILKSPKEEFSSILLENISKLSFFQAEKKIQERFLFSRLA